MAVLLTSIILALIGLTAEFQYFAHKNFWFSAYDTALQFNEIWKLFYGTDNQNTIRGLPLFGDHLWLIIAALKPVFWTENPVRVLFWIQSIALFGGGFFLFRQLIEQKTNGAITFIVILSFLLNPFYLHAALDQIHIEVIAGLFIFAMLYCYFKSYTKLGITMAILAMLCREDIAISVTAFWFAVFVFRPEKKLGASMFLISLIYFFLALKVVMPMLSPAGFFRHQHGFAMSQLMNRYTELKFYIEIVQDPQVHRYLMLLVLPFIFIHKKAYFLIIPFAAMTAVNVLSRNPYILSGTFHYDYHNLPFLFAGVVVSLQQYKSTSLRWILALSLFLLTLLTVKLHSFEKWMRIQAFLKDKNPHTVYVEIQHLKNHYLSDLNKSLAASAWLSPELAFRNHIYFLPNPLQEFYHGLPGQPHTKSYPHWILVSVSDVANRSRIAADLVNYKLVYDSENLLLYRILKDPSKAN